MSERSRFDEIGYWCEVKLDILREYAAAYSAILAKQQELYHVYIDGFAGAGIHIRKATGEFVLGSPVNALAVKPPFREFFLVDLDGDKWRVIQAAGHPRTIDLFLNFPIMDANRNALWHEPQRVAPEQAARLTAHWGDESWRQAAYRPKRQRSLFGEEIEKVENEAVAEAFRQRLRKVAGFANVPPPMPMRNQQGAVVYYLFFASQKDVANRIVRDIFRTHESRRA
jgi:hypothetical protein